MRYHDYAGVVHLHSRFSFDGRTTVSDILAAARENNLDFLLLTDHSSLAAREQGLEGWHDGTLLIVGQEISPRFNHYLAFETPREIRIHKDDTTTPPQTYIDAVREQGGMGFIAHPDHRGTALFHVKHYPWLDWDVQGYTGMGIWDFMTDFQHALTGYGQALLCFLFPAFFLRGPEASTLARWDRLTQHGRVVGIGECDNHNTVRRIAGVPLAVFPFAKAFRFIRTHILTETAVDGEKDNDIKRLLSALKAGRAYVANEACHSARGFQFWLGDNARLAIMGDGVALDGPSVLHVEVPVQARVRLIRNGQPCLEAETRHLSRRVDEPGVYRAEVYLKRWGRYRPWIFSNPIYIKRQTDNHV